jgi:preprotein translocase subunit SecD
MPLNESIAIMSAVLVTVMLAAVPQAQATAPVTRSPTLGFCLVDEQSDPSQAQQSGKVPPGDKLYPLRAGGAILLKGHAFVISVEIADATATTTQEGTVYIRLDARGAASMLRTTRDNVGHRIAAVYNGLVIDDVLVRGALGGNFELANLRAAEARALVMRFHQATK